MFDWLNNSKIKKPEQVIYTYTPRKCIKCERDMNFERPTYEDMCWDCFKKKVINITRNTHSIEESALILHLLDLARIHYKGPMGGF